MCTKLCSRGYIVVSSWVLIKPAGDCGRFELRRAALGTAEAAGTASEQQQQQQRQQLPRALMYASDTDISGKEFALN